MEFITELDEDVDINELISMGFKIDKVLDGINETTYHKITF